MDTASMKEVEAVFTAFRGLTGVALAEQAAGTAGPCLVAYVVPANVNMPALHAHVRTLLPGHLVPSAIVALDAVPRGADGAAQTLPAVDLTGLMPYRAPTTPRQQVLCNIFAEVLRVPRLGLDDDFFSLGGRSVDAMMLAGRISAELGVQMSLADLFDAPTAADLDRRFDAMTRQHSA